MQRHQLFGILHGRDVAQGHPVHLAEGASHDADRHGEREQRDRGEARRTSERARGVANILAHSAERRACGGWYGRCGGRRVRRPAHGGEDAFGDILAIIHLGQLREDAFERGLAHQVAQVLDGIVGHHLALAEDQDGGADLLHDLEDVRAVEDDLAAVGECAQQAAEHERGGDVETGEGLVEDEDFGIVEQGGGEQNFLTHALGVGGERLVAIVPEPEGAEELVHLGLEHGARNSAEAAHQLQVFAAREMGVEVRLFGHVADALLEGGEIVIDAACRCRRSGLRKARSGR